jgi:hypothetical protein
MLHVDPASARPEVALILKVKADDVIHADAILDGVVPLDAASRSG